MDHLRPKERSSLMSRVRGKDTVPELIVRRAVHGLGYRYRLHDRRLPGVPDLVFTSLGCVIFVHGCFWHRHSCRRGQSRPRTRATFWQEKFANNVVRDAVVIRDLRRGGWRILTVWECQTKDMARLIQRLEAFLSRRS